MDEPNDIVQPKYHCSITELEYLEVFMVFSSEEEWKIFFDGSKCIHGDGLEIVLVNPHGDVIPMSYRLSCDCTNTIVDDEVLILGLKVTILLKVQ